MKTTIIFEHLKNKLLRKEFVFKKGGEFNKKIFFDSIKKNFRFSKKAMPFLVCKLEGVCLNTGEMKTAFFCGFIDFYYELHIRLIGVGSKGKINFQKRSRTWSDRSVFLVVKKNGVYKTKEIVFAPSTRDRNKFEEADEMFH